MPHQQTQGVQIHGREEGKFATLTEDGVKQRVDVSAVVAGGIVSVDDGFQWDAIVPTFNTTSDVYVFSLAGATTATITVNYTNSTKAILSGVTKVVV